MAEDPHVVIVGGGFGGLAVARRLKRQPVRVTIVDRRNHHLFQPLLYQVAAGALSPGEIAMPIRRIVRRQRNAEVVLGTAVAVDVPRRVLVLEDGEIGYDLLVLAVGATHAYFGHDDWARVAPGLKTLEDALALRNRILTAFEAAEREADAGRRRAWLTFVVIGGGPTGVEMAGALAEISRRVLRADFRRIDPAESRIVLVEAGPRILATYAERSSARAATALRVRGVEVATDRPVTDVDDLGVSIGPRRVDCRTVIWAAGVAASPIARSLGCPLDRVGRVWVEPDLTVPGHPEIFVIGDLAAVPRGPASGARPPVLVPGVAPAAIQMGRWTAANVVRRLEGRPPRPFRYRDKGALATVGRAAAVAEIGGARFDGLPAWIAWLLVHIVFLIGFRNRFLVLLQWAWIYFRWESGARLILGEPRRPRSHAPPDPPWREERPSPTP